MSPSKETLGERLRKRRLERGIGLRELAGAEAVLYDESVHLIEGVATDRVERL